MAPLDRSSDVPLADQIESRLAALIASGQMPVGARLTSIDRQAERENAHAKCDATDKRPRPPIAPSAPIGPGGPGECTALPALGNR